MEKLIKPKKPIPPHVLEAKLRGDTALLSAFGRAGARKAAQNRKRARICAERAAAAAKQVDLLTDTTDEDISWYYHRIFKNDALSHHMRNLAGVSQE